MPQGEVGEIVVQGDLVTRRYFERPRADALAKIREGRRIWHRMGDVGWQDKKGRIWFCGRKDHRVSIGANTLFTVPCEAIFNNHPDVYRSALVGIGTRPHQTPLICIELEKAAARKDRAKIASELKALAKDNRLTRDIRTILFHRSFPVDIRHNSKIFREQLAAWAGDRLS